MRSVRVVSAAFAVALIIALAWSGWQAWHVNRSLSAAFDDASAVQAGISNGDAQAVDAALGDLQAHAADADSRTSTHTWGMLTHVPLIGDDAQGVRVVSAVLGDLTGDGFEQLAHTATDLGAYSPSEGRVPLESLEGLQAPVGEAGEAFARADARLSAQDASGYVGPLKTKYEAFVERISDASDALTTADQTLTLLPGLLGGEEPRTYLLVFQNNAEIRATGGLPGAWALLDANSGALSIREQGTPGVFPDRGGDPILPLSEAEAEVYGTQFGDYFQDANFTPDFTRSAQLWHAWWDLAFPATSIDGVLSIDPVAMSYLLLATGPVTAGGVTLTAENAVDMLLSRPYLTGDNAAQDAFFSLAAKAIFTAATTDLQAPIEFLRGLQRGTTEGRIHFNSFDPTEQSEVAGSIIEGALPDRDRLAPSVHVALNDATGSKMSYYLRYRVDVDARACAGGRQKLLGSMSLNQSIAAAEAAELPDDVTGGGEYGIEPGHQLVITRIYGPTEGTIDDVRLDGQRIDTQSITLDGRPVALIVSELSGPDDTVITWTMQSGPGQTGDGAVHVTPSVVPGSKNSGFGSAC